MKATQIILASRPKGAPTNDNFKFEEITLPELQEGEALLKPMYISVDPYMRGRMNDKKSYVQPFALNEPILGTTIAKVEDSKSSQFKKGDIVVGMLPWSTYSITKEEKLRKIEVNDVPASYYLGILGMPGLTAYFGLLDICKPKPGETVVISGAAGAVGIIVGQIARIMGCRVIGITGSDAKAKLLTQQFGFDDAINYKTTKDLSKVLAEKCPKKIDCYFDNVGGDISDAVIANINFNARIAICGQIALYNEINISAGIRILPQILVHSALIQGFIVNNYSKRFPEALMQLCQWVREDRIKYIETIIEGFNNLPDAFLGLFKGENTGKMIVKV